MQNILIIGATSAIAEATANLYAKQGAKLYLIARNKSRLETIAADLKIRGASFVSIATFDANDFERHQELLDTAIQVLDAIDIALIAHGTLGDQKACEASAETALKELQTNALSTISILTLLANVMEKQKKGTIAVISSVAGDRGRPSNYVYGTAKAAVTTFCQGLSVRLIKSGVHIINIKPGMVDTPMTAEMAMPAILVAKPEQIAIDIVKGIETRKDVLYTPWFWKYAMMGIIHLPIGIFKKISL
jgi:decaprenylphospho-beta-D-erythro-pentofuranosid-2-ulose 2-reductase